MTTFYSKILKSMITWFVIFEFGLRKSAYEFSLQLRSWPIRVKMCDIQRDQSTQISTVDVIRCAKLSHHHGIWEEQAKEWGVFSLPEGLFYRAAKHHLHGRHCLAFSERRSQKSTLWAICWDTPAQLQSDECARVVPSISNKVAIDTAFN